MSHRSISSSKPKHRHYTSFIIFFPIFLLIVIITLRSTPQKTTLSLLLPSTGSSEQTWYDIISKHFKEKTIKIGLVNINKNVTILEHGVGETVTVQFDPVSKDTKWTDFFPNWIDEDEKFRQQKCPEMPMPRFEDYREVDMVLAELPCGDRDVFRLQVNLVVSNLLVRIGWKEDFDGEVNPRVYVVFLSRCEPMWEIFRCDDLVYHQGDYFVYKPDLKKLELKVLMPAGSCRIAPPLSESGKEAWRKSTRSKQKEAYATVLHSSEAYVCGAIALAQSILQTNTTKDLVLLADHSISTNSIQGLKAAGWKIKRIERIRSPHAKKGAYNEWNYSKLRIWQLTEYDKIIFIDSDLIILKNMDMFFLYPELSASWNNRHLFNSGVMLAEPSTCMFETLMEKRLTLGSYNGGDQGFLNEIFTWWHRWHSNVNRLKVIIEEEHNPTHEMPEDIYTIHYLGMKPWTCYADYDCNWDVLDYHPFASDSAHRRWWKIYEAMPKNLRPYCALTPQMEKRLKMYRGRAKNASFPDGHWKIKVRDQRRQYI